MFLPKMGMWRSYFCSARVWLDPLGVPDTSNSTLSTIRAQSLDRLVMPLPHVCLVTEVRVRGSVKAPNNQKRKRIQPCRTLVSHITVARQERQKRTNNQPERRCFCQRWACGGPVFVVRGRGWALYAFQTLPIERRCQGTQKIMMMVKALLPSCYRYTGVTF
eukprot:scaffold50028_cov50-Attheya_sp.AAC.1